MSEVGHRIKKLRIKNNLTQKDLAALVNASPQKVSNWERNYTNPDHEDIARLSKALDTTSDYILFGKETSVVQEKQVSYFTQNTLPADFLHFLKMVQSLSEEDQLKFYEQAKIFVAGLKAKEKVN